MAKILFLDTEKCVGCRVCELACSAHHFNTFKRGLSAIGIIKFDEISKDVPMVCQQCERPACQAVCPSNAISRNEQLNALLIDYNKCIGCKTCVSACPFGNINFDEEEKKPIKCDLCEGEPECVKICPSDAIEYIEADRITLAKKRESLKNIPELLNLVFTD